MQRLNKYQHKNTKQYQNNGVALLYSELVQLVLILATLIADLCQLLSAYLANTQTLNADSTHSIHNMGP